MIDLDDRLLSYERVRAVSAEWSELLRALDACSRAMGELGESNHSRALSADRMHLLRRANLHLRQIAAQEAAASVRLGSTRPPPLPAAGEVDLPRLKAIRAP